MSEHWAHHNIAGVYVHKSPQEASTRPLLSSLRHIGQGFFILFFKIDAFFKKEKNNKIKFKY